MHPLRSWQLKSFVRALLALAVLFTSVAQPQAVSAQPAPIEATQADAQAAQQATQADAQAAQPQATEVAVTASGFQPTFVEVDAGQPVHFTNASSQAQTVTHDGASSGGTMLFDSSSIPPGGGFSLALLAPGDHALRSTTSNHLATLRVRATGLPGPASDPVRNHIPNVAFPRARGADVASHPQWGIQASRTRIMVGFTSTATVAQANAALAAANATVQGGLPSLGVVLVTVPDSADFSTLTSALQSLRSNPVIEFAAMSTRVQGDVTPRPTESGMLIPGSTSVLDWTWDERGMGGAVVPHGANASIEAVRAPQGWNLLQAIRKKNASVQTAIVDSGFEAHPDLGNLQVATLCRPGVIFETCTRSRTDDHGNHVAGIVGASFDNDGGQAKRSRGVNGVNPVAQMHGVSFTGMATSSDDYQDAVSTDDQLIEALALTISEKRQGGVLPNLRVINLSAGALVLDTNERTNGTDERKVPVWEDKFKDKRCGPGEDDDAAGALLCTPANEDGWLREYAHNGRLALRLAQSASAADVVIVKSAGNNARTFCSVFAAVPCSAHMPPLTVHSTNEFAWAARNWGSSTGFPVIIVEAYAADETGGGIVGTTTFSQRDGDVSAPGAGVWSTGSRAALNPLETHGCHGGGGTINFLNSSTIYCSLDGTSMAAPHVTGLIGLLLAFKPELTGSEVIAAVKDRAISDGYASRGLAPGIDVYGSLMALPGAVLAMVDVNHDTPDGNQRAILGPSSGSTPNVIGDLYGPTTEFAAEPDGVVDMRDFRRFRDAWLQLCQEADELGTSLPAGCPSAGDIALNGSRTHSKFDLNWDRCSFVSPDISTPGSPRDPLGCEARERTYPRFDFNGDGQVDLGLKSKVPFGSSGQPLSAHATEDMTDLEVLLTQWPSLADQNEGWSREQVSNLMTSADIEVHASAFFEAGAEEVWIHGRRGGTPLPSRKLLKDQAKEALDQNYVIASVPTGAGVDIWASTTLPDGQRLESPVKNYHPLPGEDVRFDMCASHLTIDGGPLSLPADGVTQGIFTATLVGCPGDIVSGKPITFSLASTSGQGDASLTRENGITDAAGRLVTAVTAGTQTTEYTLTAELDLGNGRVVKAKKALNVTPQVTISYIWLQTALEWVENGTTRWVGAPGNMPDCTTAGVSYCIDNFLLRLNTPYPEWQSEGLQRKGRLVGGAERFKLSEEAAGINWSQATYTLDHLDGTSPFEGHYLGYWGPAESDSSKYQNHDVQGVRSEMDANEIRLYGLKNVGELGYKHASQTGAGTALPETHFTRDELLLVPHGDGSAIRHSFDMDRAITFKKRSDGTFEPYTFRGVFTKSIESGPRYLQPRPDDWVYGAYDPGNDLQFDPGDRPQMTLSGHLRIRYCFQAVATVGTEPLPVTLPDCSQNHPPVADFDIQFADQAGGAGEGRVVQFKDRSKDPDNDIRSWSWDFGEAPSPRQQCRSDEAETCHLYADNGIYSVKLTVTDSEGLSASVTKQVAVRNLPPEPAIERAIGREAGPLPGCGTLRVNLRVWDPGWLDQDALTIRVTSTNAAWPGNNPETVPAGSHTLTVTNVPVGEYPLTLTATDKDGTSATASAMAHVVECDDPPPPEPTPPAPYITCDVNVVLDVEEQLFLNLLNAYRIQNGLPPLLGVSASLSKAADRHAHDMATNNFMAHTGSDGSSIDQRVREAGFKGSMHGENIARGMARAVDAMIAWKGSHTGHNENMLNPAWKGIAIARERNATTGEWFWATNFGNVLDCPTPAPLAATSSFVSEADFSDSIAVLGPSGAPHVFAPRDLRFAVSAQQQPAVGAPAPAFVVSRVAPRVGETVTFTNASRDGAGQPIAAVLDLGDDSASVSLAPGATHQHVYTSAALRVVTLTSVASVQFAVARPLSIVAGAPVPGLGQPGVPLAWGRNEAGELGDGQTRTERFSPASVSSLGIVTAVEAGDAFAIALLADGGVWGWGANSSGQLGDGSFVDRPRPVPASLPKRVRQIATGRSHVLALDSDGTVWTWGSGYKGVLGIGSEQSRSQPQALASLPPISRIGAGDNHSLAVAADGSVWAWGHNLFGQIGNGEAGEGGVLTPTRVLGPGGSGFLQGIQAVGGGSDFSLALGTDGSVWAWGDDQYGQLGRNTRNQDSRSPVQVLGPSGSTALGGINAIAGGDEFALALGTDGRVWAWGRSDLGQLGAPAPTICGFYNTPCSPRPVQTHLSSGVKAVSVGASHALAIASDDRLWAWGSNHDGELGESSDVDSRIEPIAIAALGSSTVLSIGAGSGVSLAVGQAEAPTAPFNDSFASATAVDTASVALTGNTLLATVEASEVLNGACGAVGNTVWYRLSPTTSERLVATTSGSYFDTRLTLFSDALQAITCDESVLSAELQAGQTYFVQLGGKSAYPGIAHAGQFQLAISLGSAPANDDFSSMQHLALPATLAADTTFATTQSGEPLSGCGVASHRSVWYSFSATGSMIEVSANGTGFRPHITLYESTSEPPTLASLRVEGCGGDQTPTRILSNVVAGQTYYVRVAGENDAGGPVSVIVRIPQPPANDDFVNAASLQVPGTAGGSLILATAQTGEPRGCGGDAPSVWYRLQPSAAGRATIRVTSSGTAHGSLYRATAAGLSGLQRLDTDCASFGEEPGTQVAVVEAGVSPDQSVYLQVVDELHEGMSFTVQGTLETSLPDLAVTQLSAPSTIAADQPLVVTFEARNTGNVATAVANKARLVAENGTTTRELGLVTLGTLAAGASTSQTISVPSNQLPVGSYGLSLELDHEDDIRELDDVNNVASRTLLVTEPAAAARDAFAEATLLPIPGIAGGSTASFTTEAGEPLACGSSTMSHTTWFRVAPTAAGALTLNTSGSDYDTVLALYTGSSLSTLQQVACNDDAGGGARTSRLVAPVQAGTTYFVQLGGYNAASGTFALSAHVDSSGKSDVIVTGVIAAVTTADQPVPVTVSVANNGSSSTAGGVQIFLYADPSTAPQPGMPTSLPVIDVAALDIGATATVHAVLPAGTLAQGPHTLWALVDGPGAVAESDETNNASSVTVTVDAATPPPTGPDFAIALAPASVALVPGSSASLTVELASLLGFQQPVSLSVSGLPQGVSGTFYPSTVTPSGTSVLSLTASTSTVKGTFPIVVTATSGALVHTTGSSVSVDFGLIPVCFGAFSGQVVDTATGAPLVGANVNVLSTNVTTDGQGRYTIRNLALGDNNAPRQHVVSFNQTGYLPVQVVATAVCGATIPLSKVELVSEQRGVVSGDVGVGVPDPNNHTPSRSVTATTQPVADAKLTFHDGSLARDTAFSDANGHYVSESLPLGTNNAPKTYQVTADATGHWPETRNISVASGSNTFNVALVPQCTSTITGLVADSTQSSNSILARASVGFGMDDQVYTTSTDGQRRFTLTGVLLGYRNSRVTYTFPGYKDAAGNTPGQVTVEDCAVPANVVLVETPSGGGNPNSNIAIVSGTVTDEETGFPVASGIVAAAGLSPVPIGPDGTYLLAITWDISQPNIGLGIAASKDSYWPKTSSVTLQNGQALTLNFTLQRKHFGVINGTVRDSVTYQGIEGARINDLTGAALTGNGGVFTSDSLELAQGNQPRELTFSVSQTGYWTQSVNATLRADQTTSVTVDLLKVCQGATISGRVINAANGNAIEGAKVAAQGKDVNTDKNGLFVLGGLTVGYANSAVEIEVKVTAAGFLPQSKNITIFCGANLTLNFGDENLPSDTTPPVTTAMVTPSPNPEGWHTTDVSVALTATDNTAVKEIVHALSGPQVVTAGSTASVNVITEGTTTLTYFARDTLGNVEASKTLTLKIDKHAPIAQSSSFTTAEATAIEVGLEASDSRATALTYAVIQQPTHGTLSGTAPNLTYTPHANFEGTDSFTFRASDGVWSSNTATVSMTVKGGPDLALAKTHTGTFTTGKQGTYTLKVTNVGSAATTGSIVVTDTLPAGLTFASATGSGWTCAAQAPVVTCTRSAVLAVGASSGITLKVNVTNAAVPSVTNTASVATAGDTQQSNDQASDPTTVTLAADTTVPSCALTKTGTDTQGRKFIEVTVQDIGSGMKEIMVTQQTNLSPVVPPFTQGATVKLVVRATKIDQAASSQLAMRVTDVAGNAVNCDPIDQVLVAKDGKPARYTFKDLPQADRYVQISNGTPGVKVLILTVNGKKYNEKQLKDGEVRVFDVAKSMKPGDRNTVVAEVRGKPGETIWLLMSDVVPPGASDEEPEEDTAAAPARLDD